MSKRVVVVDFGDTHAGSELGLLHPETVLEQEREDGTVIEYNPSLSEIQNFLFYDVYRPKIKEIIAFADGDDIYAFHKGDITQGQKYSEELNSGRMSDQILIAIKNMTELLQYPNVKKFRMIKGTSSHVFGEGSSEVIVKNTLKLMYPEKDIALHTHGLYTIQEVDLLLDMSHHGPSAGIRKWLEGNNFRYYIRDIMLRDKLSGKRVPDVISRAHTHTPIDEYLSLNGDRTWGFITPPMQFVTSYARQVTQSISSLGVGLLAYEIILHDNGRKTIWPEWFTKTLDIRTKEIL